MKTRFLFKSWLSLGLATLLMLGVLGTAQATENKAPAWGLISQKGSVTPHDAVWLVMGNPADPSYYNNLIYLISNERQPTELNAAAEALR